jgi:hypothetical protein
MGLGPWVVNVNNGNATDGARQRIARVVSRSRTQMAAGRGLHVGTVGWFFALDHYPEQRAFLSQSDMS